MTTIDILQLLGIYQSEDQRLFEQKVKRRALPKNEILLREGEICKSMFFTISGAVYQYHLGDGFEENIIDLHSDNEWFFNHTSFISQKPSDRFIKTFSETELLELTIESLHELIQKSPVFLQLAKIFDQATDRIHFFDHRLTPSQKYMHILENRPGLIQKFPLKYIASYLKIAPETLSRVRETISKGESIS